MQPDFYSHHFLSFFKNLFVFDRAGSSLRLRLFSSRSERGLPSSCGVHTSHCGSFSCGTQALGHTGFSSCGPQALERRLSSSHWLTGKSQELFLDVIDTLPAFILKRKGDLLSSNFFFFLVILFIFGCAGSWSLLGLVSSCGKWGLLSLVAVCGLYFVASLGSDHGL